MVKVTKAGVTVFVEDVYTDPVKIQELIDRLTQAKVQLAEHNSRSAEEGYKDLWESSS